MARPTTKEKTMSIKISLGPVFLIFLILKLTGLVDWSWWTVTSPLWLPFAVVLAVAAVVSVVTFFGVLAQAIFRL